MWRFLLAGAKTSWVPWWALGLIWGVEVELDASAGEGGVGKSASGCWWGGVQAMTKSMLRRKISSVATCSRVAISRCDCQATCFGLSMFQPSPVSTSYRSDQLSVSPQADGRFVVETVRGRSDRVVGAIGWSKG